LIAIKRAVHIVGSAFVADAVEEVLDTAWEAIKKGLETLLEVAAERAVELVEHRLSALGVGEPAAIARRMRSLPESDRQRVDFELQELGRNGTRLIEVVKQSLQW